MAVHFHFIGIANPNFLKVLSQNSLLFVNFTQNRRPFEDNTKEGSTSSFRLGPQRLVW